MKGAVIIIRPAVKLEAIYFIETNPAVDLVAFLEQLHLASPSRQPCRRAQPAKACTKK
jgi:hypothetical protein